MILNDAPALRVMFEDHLLNALKGQNPLSVAVVYPCDRVSLEGAVLASEMGLIRPVLIGPAAKIHDIAQTSGLKLDGMRIEDQEDPLECATIAGKLAKDRNVDAIMKGSLHTNDLMRGIVSKEAGLRTNRRMSHVFIIDHMGYHKPIFITDAALNIAPTLMEKRDIAQNAIDLAHQFGINQPRVAVLAAVETVEENIEATMHAAALCKMADRGQITGALLDGPLALDLALSAEAVRIKGLVSNVAGNADILLVPNYEAGNMLAKEMEHIGAAHTAGVVLGARVPIILTSRADSARTRAASCMAAIVAVRGVKEALWATC